MRWLLGGLLFLVACEDPGTEAARRSPPRLVLAETGHDFGRVAQGAIVEHTFTVSNRGERDLQIVRLRSAGDTKSRMASREVAGGTSLRLDVSFDTAAVFGPQTRTFTLYANDGEHPVTVLHLTGEVAVEAAADPPALYVGTVRAGRLAARSLRIVTAEGVRVEGVSTDGPHLDVASSASTDGEPGRDVEIRISSGAPPGPFEQTVEVRTSSPARPFFVVPVIGRVGPRVEVLPARLSAALTETLIENHGEEAVQLLAAEVRPASLAEASVETVRKGFRYRLRALPGDGAPAAEGMVRVTTNDPEQPLLEIPIDMRASEAQPVRGAGGGKS